MASPSTASTLRDQAGTTTEVGGIEELATTDRRANLASALDALPAEQRTALEMAYFEGLSHGEIAERTSQPLGTVKTRIRLAMEKLRQGLGSLREDGS